ncbi:MAG: hypothetical protein ACM3VS_12920 [Candidatus Dadabacteria bacterium]
MRKVFLRTILVFPLYLVQPGSVNGNNPGCAAHRFSEVKQQKNIENVRIRKNQASSLTITAFPDLYPADALAGIGHLVFFPPINHLKAPCKGSLVKSKKSVPATTNLRISEEPAKTTFMFILASVLTFIGTARFATTVRFYDKYPSFHHSKNE